MSKYSEFVKELKANSKGDTFSKADLVSLSTELFNDNSAAIEIYVKKGDTFETKTITPGANVRNALIAPILKGFGVDRAEMGKLADVQTSRAGGEALADFSLMLIKEYVSKNGLGRKLTLPMTSSTEVVSTLGIESVPEKEMATNAIVRNEDGTYSTKPTGKVVTTAAHDKIVVKGRVPSWLKTTKAK